MRAQHSLAMQQKHTRTMQWLQRSVYAREGATAMDHQESDSRILRHIPFFEPAEDLCYNINITNTQHSLQEKSRQLSVFFVSVTQKHGGYGCVP